MTDKVRRAPDSALVSKIVRRFLSAIDSEKMTTLELVLVMGFSTVEFLEAGDISITEKEAHELADLFKQSLLAKQSESPRNPISFSKLES